MKHKAFIYTFLSRILILTLNFGIVIYSTNLWGSVGKGVITIITADLAIITFFSNIFTGSSVSYFSSKFKEEQILSFAYIWSLIIGISLPIILGFFHGNQYTLYLVGSSIFSALLTANINLFVGKQNIKMFNLYTILQLLVHVLFLLSIVYIVKITSVTAYFIAQIFCYLTLFLISAYQLTKTFKFNNLIPSKAIVKDLFDYGWKSQLSAFLQFLNNRLSFYFLEFFKGIASVGIFSVGIALSEAIWTVSRSLAVILYSDVINNNDSQSAIVQTKLSIKLSFLITLVFIAVVLVIPASLYTLIFGKDFHETKTIFLLLAPGVLAIAVSNIVGFYFAAVNKLKILNIKSILGLTFTVIASFYFIPNFGIVGACIVTSVSYCLSSALLLWQFNKLSKFQLHDFIISRTEVKSLIKKIRK